jgi:hypothetical protein
MADIGKSTRLTHSGSDGAPERMRNTFTFAIWLTRLDVDGPLAVAAATAKSKNDLGIVFAEGGLARL